MFVLGIIVGFLEIVGGIIVLSNSDGQSVIIILGIGYLLSGALFIWLCLGAEQAFTNEKRINELKWKVRELEIKSNVSIEMLKKAGLTDEAIQKELAKNFIGINSGDKLISLVEKKTPDELIVIPADAEVTFDRIENRSDGTIRIYAKAEADGKKLTIAYKEEEVKVK